MKLIPFKLEHKFLIKGWLRAHGLSTDLVKMLPLVGFLVEADNELVAAGFLRVCEGHFGIIDSLITDPEAKPEVRHEALDLIVSTLIKVAKTAEIKHLIAHTLDKSIIARSERHGFHALPYSVIGLDLISEQGVE